MKFLAALFLAFVTVPAHAFCYDPYTDIYCLQADTLDQSRELNETTLKLLNVVNNNSRIDHHVNDLKKVRHDAYKLYRSLKVFDSYYIQTNHEDLRQSWTALRARLHRYASRYPDLRLHLNRTQSEFEELSRLVNILVVF